MFLARWVRRMSNISRGLLRLDLKKEVSELEVKLLKRAARTPLGLSMVKGLVC